MENVYDDSYFFEQYSTMRQSEINANNLIENPIMKSMLPCLKDKTILDLGCGDGNMCRYFLQKDAKSVVGVDISKNMIESANQTNCDERISYMVLPMENINQLDKKFDIVYSSLAFHYIKDFDKLLFDIYNLLNENGILIFSQESPVNTCSVYLDKDQEKKVFYKDKRYILFSDYGNEGERCDFWNDTAVTKYHRTYATIVNLLLKNNFVIQEIKDSFASKQAVELCEKYQYQVDKPYFTFVRAIKQK